MADRGHGGEVGHGGGIHLVLEDDDLVIKTGELVAEFEGRGFGMIERQRATEGHRRFLLVATGRDAARFVGLWLTGSNDDHTILFLLVGMLSLSKHLIVASIRGNEVPTSRLKIRQ